MKTIPKPWTPVIVEEGQNECEVLIKNKKYSINKNVLFSSIITSGQELLADKMRIVSKENGKDSVWSDAEVFLMNESDEESATICATARSESFYVNTALKIEYDGCVKVDIKIMPSGLWVRETIFGAQNEREYNLDSFWVEIPLKKEVATLYQMFPHHMSIYLEDGTEKKGGYLGSGDYLPKCSGSVNKTIGQFLLLNDEVGLGCFFEDKKNWQLDDYNKCVEFINKDECVILRIRLLDSRPKKWVHTSFMNDLNNFSPISFSFGLQTLPLKDFPKNPYHEHTLHIDAFKKLDNDYEEFLAEPFVYDDGTETNEKVYDRLKRLGVNTLYLHEKWNTFQNSIFISKKSANRLKTIISECHKRHIKVIPYFGYEISSLMPQYSEHIEKIVSKNANGNYRNMWNRVPYQRDPAICYNNYWQDVFAEGIEQLIKEYGFDGIYLDTTISITDCANEEHGCGYRDENGNLQPTYAFWATRKLMKKLYRIMESHGATIDCHTSASYSLSALSHCHSILEGEVPQLALINGTADRLPEGLFRSNYTGRQFGLPIHFVVYPNPPVWNFADAFTFSILMGAYPKSVDTGLPLDKMSELWKIVDKFPINNSVWHPYWKNDTVNISDERIKCSYYEYDDLLGNKNLLMFVGNIAKAEIKNVEINIEGNVTIKQLMPQGRIKNGSLNIDFEPFESYIFVTSIENDG